MRKCGIVTKQSNGSWKLNSNVGTATDASLIDLLDHLASNGWRIAGVGNFGNSELDEIIVEHD